MVPGCLDGLLDSPPVAERAGIETQLGDARLDGRQRQLGVEMDVGDYRQSSPLDNPPQRSGRRPVGDGAADQLAAGAGERLDLCQRGFGVAGVGLGHRLDGDRRTASDLQAANPDPRRLPTLHFDPGRHLSPFS